MDVSNLACPNDLLRQERIRCSWRQSEVADRLGTTVVTVNRWERGIQQPSAYFRLKLCALMGEIALFQGEMLQALPLLEKSMAVFKEKGDIFPSSA